MGEPCYDVAHLGHVEVLTDRFEESLDFFTRVYGLTAPARERQRLSPRLRRLRVPFAEAHPCPTTGVGHIAYRAASPAALARRVAAIEASGAVVGWVDGDLGHGRGLPVPDPFGHVFEIYWDTVRTSPPAGRGRR